MARAVYEVEGGKQLRRTLKAAGVSLASLKNVHKAAAALAAAAAARKAPRVTGRLAGNVRAGATQRAGIVRAGGARIPYAGPIHWGWSKRNISANPFMVDAAKQTEPQWVQLYADYTEKALETIEGK